MSRMWKTTSQRWLAAAATGMAIAVPVVVVGCHRTPQESATDLAPTVARADWSVRQTYAYSTTLESEAKLPSGNAAFSLELDGELRLDVVSSGSGVVKLLATLEKLKLTLGGTNDAEADRVAQALQAPALFVLDHGRVDDAWYEPGLSGIALSMWRTVMGAIQLSAVDGAASGWSTEEYDSSGRYHAEYTRSGDQVVRRKTGYVALLRSGSRNAKTPPGLLPKVKESLTRFTLANGLLHSAQQREVVATRFDELASLDVETKVSLKLKAERPQPRAGGWDHKAFVAKARRIPPDRPAPSARELEAGTFDHLRMQGRDFATLLSELDEHATDPAKKRAWGVEPGQDSTVASDSEQGKALRARTSAFSALVAFLRSKPGTVGQALTRIRAGSPATNGLISGLGSAGTEECQQALITLLGDDSLGNKARLRAMIALSHSDRPVPSAAAALRKLIADSAFGDQALLGLGSMSRRLRDAGRNEEATANYHDLASALRQASDADTKANALLAISNSGDESLLPELKPFLSSPEPRVRAAAVLATRHMDLPEVEPIVARGLASENDSEVQHALLKTAKARGASGQLVAALQKLMESATSENVRRRARALARLWSRDYPSLRAIGDEAASHQVNP